MTSEKSVKTINSTVIKSHAGKKVQPTIPRAANNILVKGSEDQNKHITKGICANEYIKMANDDYSDVVDDYEDEIDKQLFEEGIELVEEVLHTDDELSNYGDTQDLQTGIYFPETFVEQMPARGKSQLITEAVEYYIKTPFVDRQHRISVKREILQFERGEVGKEDLSELAMEWINVDPVPSDSDTEEQETEDDSSLEYSYPSEYIENADEVKQTKKARIPYLQEFVDCIGRVYGFTSEDYPQNEEQLVKEAEDLFLCSTSSARDYADGVKIDYGKIAEAKEREWYESEKVREVVNKAIENGQTDNWNWVDREKFVENIANFDEDLYMEKETVLLSNTSTTTNWYLIYDPDSEHVGEVVETEKDDRLGF